ncbi:hypothetical protein WIS52_09890 [Pseudonocardia nematodicida]|uniref:Uncharacterized protein n=1 Tax=Pseudonocardia nematodicida TaxID=1206997 RepID=A0ABV1K8I0_9PSEU
MASIDEVRAGIGQANQKATESLGALRQARLAIEEARSLLAQVVEGSSQSDVEQARAYYSDAAEKVDDVEKAVHAATQAAEEIATRL